MTKLIYLKMKATQKFTQAKIFLDFHTLTDGKHPKKNIQTINQIKLKKKSDQGTPKK